MYQYGICNNFMEFNSLDNLNIPQLRDDVAYFDYSAEALSLCLNPASYYISSITGSNISPS